MLHVHPVSGYPGKRNKINKPAKFTTKKTLATISGHGG